MLALLKLIQQLVKTLNSDGTPGQIAAGVALGAALGLTPLMNLHNLVVAALILLLNVSVPGAMLGWALAAPAGFALDPLFDRVGEVLLLETPALRPFWERCYNLPLVALTNFNNTVVLGSLVGWLASIVPLYLATRWAVGRYRARLYPRLAQTRLFQVVSASKLYNLYRLFRPS